MRSTAKVLAMPNSGRVSGSRGAGTVAYCLSAVSPPCLGGKSESVPGAADMGGLAVRTGQWRAEDWSLATQSAAAMRADSHLNLGKFGGRVDSLGVCIDSSCARFCDRRPLFRYLFSVSEPNCFRERAHGREECVEQPGCRLLSPQTITACGLSGAWVH